MAKCVGTWREQAAIERVRTSPVSQRIPIAGVRNAWVAWSMMLGAVGITALSWQRGPNEVMPEPPVVATEALPQSRQVIPSELLDGTSSVAETPIAIRVFATIPRTLTGEGRARLGVSGTYPHTYATGSVLANGSRLAAVFIDHVVLERNGVFTTLYVEGSGRVAPQNKAQRDLQMVGAAADGPVLAPVSPVSVSDYVRANPVYAGQTMTGIEVFPSSRSTAFSRLGLSPGDIILSIRGVPLNDPGLAWESFRTLVDGDVMPVLVSRHGATMSLVLDGGMLLEESSGSAARQVVTASARSDLGL